MASQLRCGSRRMRAPFAPPRLSLSRYVVADQVVIDGRHRFLPQQVFVGNLRTEVALLRAHVAVQELKPGSREGVLEVFRILLKALHDLAVRRVALQGDVGREHHRVDLRRRVVRVRHGLLELVVFRLPLPRTAGAFVRLPFVVEQVVEVAGVPLRGRLRPRPFDAAGDGVGAVAGAVLVLPAEALLLEGGRLGLGADVVVGTGTVDLAKGVSAGDEGGGLDVVHGHPPERDADALRRPLGVGRVLRTFGVDVDEAHHGCAERTGQLVVLVEPVPGFHLVLRAPVDRLVGLVVVGAAAAEPKRGEAHRLQGDVAGQDHQVGPRNLAAVLLLDGPQEAARLVEIGVVGPAVERGQTLASARGAAAAVGGAIGARSVPRHANEEGTVVAVVGRPPVFRGGHHLLDVLLQRGIVEVLKGGGVVEVAVPGTDVLRVLVEDLDVEAVGPPVAVGGGRFSSSVGGPVGVNDRTPAGLTLLFSGGVVRRGSL